MTKSGYQIGYSYIRFSSPSQREGDSLRRQTEATEKYAAEHNIVLDRTLNLLDDGISAFKGAHRQEGSLKGFLDAVRCGRVKPGSVLIIENLDRLTREEMTTSLHLLTELLLAGIEIVTLTNRQRFSREILNRDPTGLFFAFGTLWRGWEESHVKSIRLKAAWKQKVKVAYEEGKATTSVGPAWLKLEKSGQWSLVQERVKKVKLIFWLTSRGWGKRRIARLFNQQKVEAWGLGEKKGVGWHASYITKILFSRAVLGEFVPHHVDPEQGRVPAGGVIQNYFPRILSDLRWAKAHRRSRGPKGPAGKKVSNLFQGICKDGRNGAAMHFRDHGDAKGKWRYLVSDDRRINPQNALFAWNYPKLELLLINYLHDLDWSLLHWERNAKAREQRDRLHVLESKLSEVQTEMKRLVGAIKIVGEIEDLSAELAKSEAQKAALNLEVQRLKNELAELEGQSPQKILDLIREAAASNSLENRLRLRDEIRRQVAQIDLFPSVPADLLPDKSALVKAPVDWIELLKGKCIKITFRSGPVRWLVDKDLPDGFCIRLGSERSLKAPQHIESLQDFPGGKLLQDRRTDSAKGGTPRKKERMKRESNEAL